LTAEFLEQVDQQRPSLVCLVATPPGGLAHTRYLCKRLRARFPELKILVCRWAPGSTDPTSLGHVREAGADVIATTLLETRHQLASLLPVLAQANTDPDHARRARNGAGEGPASLNRGKERRHANDRDAIAHAASS
jgi:hypothetical protein